MKINMTKTWKSVLLSPSKAAQFRVFLLATGITFEPCQCGDKTYFSVFVDEDETEFCNDFLFYL